MVAAARCARRSAARQSQPTTVKLFISYPSDQRDLCERLRLALEAEDHEVFTDRAELKEGEHYHEALRDAIEQADAMVFVVTPRAVAPGSYALTELDLAQRRWRTPGGHMLPVLAEPTPLADIPPYLRSVTLLQPRGDLVAETVAAVDRLRPDRPIALWLSAAAVLLLVAVAAAWGVQRWQQQRAAEQARLEWRAAELAAAAQLCDSGSHAVAWDQFNRIVDADPADAAARRAREDCGMRWLREMRTTSDKESFSAQVALVLPALAQALLRAAGQRRADLRAHLGWAEFLRSRDGVSTGDPLSHYEAALADDPGNVYAHAMWAHRVAWTSGRIDATVREHFDAAAQDPRDRAWLRRIQFSVAYNHRGLHGYAWAVADEMRRDREQTNATQRDSLWRAVIDGALLDARDRKAVLDEVSAEDSLATFAWLYPPDAVAVERQPLHRYALALFEAHAGRRDAARQALEALRGELSAANDEGRLARAVDTLLAELRASG